MAVLLLHSRTTSLLLHPHLPARSSPRLRAATMSSHMTSAVGCSASDCRRERRLPVLLFDVMDTIVRDPFYEDVPAFFQMPMKQLLERKHPTAWIEFEKGLIDEMELAKKFFKDGTPFDMEGLKECMLKGYSYIDGIEDLLCTLKRNNYEMHAFTNYPVWYKMIEGKLGISKYLSWTFCSCMTGKRKPEPDFYVEVVHHLGVSPENCIFVDDRASPAATMSKSWRRQCLIAGDQSLRLWTKLNNKATSMPLERVLHAQDAFLDKLMGRLANMFKEFLVVQNMARPLHNTFEDNIFMDTIPKRIVNVEAARHAGMIGIHFKNADSLKRELSSCGADVVNLEN